MADLGDEGIRRTTPSIDLSRENVEQVAAKLEILTPKMRTLGLRTLVYDSAAMLRALVEQRDQDSDLLVATEDGTEKTSIDSWTHQIVQQVLHVLHPECPAFPGIPNACSPIICDCGNADNSGNPLAVQVMDLIAERDALRQRLEKAERELQSHLDPTLRRRKL